jgi:hypothetical protein
VRIGDLEIRIACESGYDGGDEWGYFFVRKDMVVNLFLRACTFADDSPAGSGRYG